MSNSVCRAKNPSTCRNHGSSENIISTFVSNGDIDGFIDYKAKSELNSNKQRSLNERQETSADPTKRPRRSENQLNSKGEKKDRADAEYIFDRFNSYKNVNMDEYGGHTRTMLREHIQKIWQEPRMPRLLHSHNKPLEYPWSPEARNLFFGDKKTGELFLEHTTPISLLVEEVLAEVRKPDCTPEKIYDFLIKKHEPLSFTVITRAENKILDGKGLRSSMGTIADPFGRYEEGLKLKDEDFIAVVEDKRYPEYEAAQKAIKEAIKAQRKAERLAKKKELLAS